MSPEANDLWERARLSLKTAAVHVEDDPDSAASRAYYAAFHAVSALFSLMKKDFSKHSALEAAVHRDLVKPGIWTKEQGSDYSWLVNARSTGDYGGKLHVSPEDARQAIAKAEHILQVVSAKNPETFSL